MPLLVARSLAVYGASAALLIWLARRYVLALRLRTVLLLAAAPLLFTGHATLTGGVYGPVDILYGAEPFAATFGAREARTPLLSDVTQQMFPWQKAVRDSFASGALPLWSPFALAGEPLLAVQQPAALHPGTWISLLLPLPQAWTFQMSLRLLIALLSAFLFLRDAGCRDASAMLGAAAWAFSDFMIFWLGYPVANSVGPFPLLLLGLARLVRDVDRRAVGLTATALVLIALAGHPETLLYAVTLAGVFFLFQLAAAGPGKRLRPVLLSLVAGAIALGISAIQLASLAEALPQTWEYAMRSSFFAHSRRSGTLIESARRAVPILLPFAYGQSGHGRTWLDFGVPASYAGTLLLPLALTGLLSRHRLRLPLFVMGVLGAALWVRLVFVTDAVAWLPLFRIGVLEYFTFAAIFAVAALAALGVERLRDGEGSVAFVVGTFVTAGAIVCLFFLRREGMANLGMSGEFIRGRLLRELVPLACGLLVVAGTRRMRRPVSLLAIVVAFRVAEAGSVYPTLPASDFYPPLPVLDAIPRGGPERFVGTSFIFVPNIATAYGLEDVRGYDAMTFRPLYETYPLWCVPQPAWFNRVDDLGRPFLSFLNVRYAIVPSGTPAAPGWKTLSRGPAGDILENPAALARAFVPAWIHYEPDGPRRIEVLKAITDFGDRGVVGSPAPPSSPEWVRNGSARVSVASYRPQSMAIAVEADAEAVVATSVTAWQGWQARLDGVEIVPLSYNHAFLAFPVPAGAHRIELRYFPKSVRLGAILSLATLVAAVVLSRLRYHRSRNMKERA
jgi:Bacterial membrane protein YfhO